MKAQGVSNTLWAWGTLVEHGFSFTSIVDKSSWFAVIERAKAVHPHTSAQDKRMMHPALDIIKAPRWKEVETLAATLRTECPSGAEVNDTHGRGVP